MTRILLGISFILFFGACSENDSIENPIPTPTTPVILDLNEVPYSHLSDYNFFQGEIKNLNPVLGVVPYDLINTLFADYAYKKRFIWLPNGTHANYINENETLSFPNGSAVIKNFYYNNVEPSNRTQIIETRLMIRKNGTWLFFNYVWNDEQTEATLDLAGSNKSITWQQNGELITANYRIPSEQECFTCHKVDELPSLIGPKPQNLNKIYNYEDGAMNQLDKWKSLGYISETSIPSDIETVSNWQDTSIPIQERVRGYLDINCAHCHQDLAHCDYTPIRFAWDESDIDANMGICVENVEPLPGFSYIVKPANANRSALFERISSTEENIRMPIIGRSIVHEEAKILIDQWINNMTPNDCE